MKIAVVGLGYVGVANAILLAQNHETVAVDIMQEKVDMINSGKPTIMDSDAEKYLAEKNLKLKATTDFGKALKGTTYVVIATPTDYDPEKNFFDTSSVEDVIEKVLRYNPDAIIIIKSTIPVGYVMKVRKKYKMDNIIFSPEFLREGKALYDNLHPNRIIIGERSERAKAFAELLKEGAVKKRYQYFFLTRQRQKQLNYLPIPI